MSLNRFRTYLKQKSLRESVNPIFRTDEHTFPFNLKVRPESLKTTKGDIRRISPFL